MAGGREPSDHSTGTLRWWQFVLLVVFWPVGLVVLLRWSWRRTRSRRGLRLGAAGVAVVLAILSWALAVTVRPASARATIQAAPAAIPGGDVPVSTSPSATVSARVPATSRTATPTPASAPPMRTLRIGQDALSLPYPATWKVSQSSGGAAISDPKSTAQLWLQVWSGDNGLGSTANEVQEVVTNLTGKGGRITLERYTDDQYQVRGVVGNEVQYYFGFIGEGHDYTIDWTYPITQAPTIDAAVARSVKGFAAN